MSYVTNTAGIALDISGLVMLTIMLISMFFSRYNKRHWTGHFSQLFNAAVLHFIALSMKIAGGENVLYVDASPQVYRMHVISALALDCASVLFFLLFLFSDTDGKLRLDKRVRPISGIIIFCGILPNLLALVFEQMLPEISILGMSYAVSLSLAYIVMRLQNETVIEEAENMLTMRQNKVLVEQIQPHFIFNSLSAIEALCYIDPMAAAKSLEDFSGYLRGNIDALSSEDPISFETELQHIRQYIALEQADPARAFTVEYDLKFRDFDIPALTVQPIAENAVKHGALSHTDGSGVVRISTDRIGNFIQIVVEDNGIGAAVTDKQKSHRSTGIESVKARLAAQCGGSLNITHADNGTKAIFMIPQKGEGK